MSVGWDRSKGSRPRGWLHFVAGICILEVALIFINAQFVISMAVCTGHKTGDFHTQSGNQPTPLLRASCSQHEIHAGSSYMPLQNVQLLLGISSRKPARDRLGDVD